MLRRLRTHARPLARLGCAAIGTVYVLLGIVAVLALAGVFTGAADEDRLIHAVIGLPGGALLVWGIVAGLCGYVVWRVVEALADPYEFGTDLRGLVTRTGVALSGLAYGGIALSAALIASGSGPGPGDAAEEEQQQLVAQVLEWPAGAWLVGLIGVLVIAVAAVQVAIVVRRGYTVEIRLSERRPWVQQLIHGLAWYGYLARSTILGVLGYFFLRGALREDPGAVGDTDTAFDYIGGGLVGDSAFFVVAVGTIAYGVFMYLTAVFYQFEKRQRGDRSVREGLRGPAPGR